MKKLIQAITAVAIAAMLSVSASAAVLQAGSSATLKGAYGQNISQNNYLTYADTVKSYIQQTDNGFRRVEYYDGKLVIEEYDSNLTLLSAKNIYKPSYIFGGCYLGEDFNVVVWGKENPNENDENTVLLIEKYTKNWQTTIKSVSVKGINTTVPFDAGSLRMTMAGSSLYIHTSHEMYKSNDGYNHQANMTFVVDTATMTVTDSWYEVMNIGCGYVSHSFNQFIKNDGDFIYRVDHGDAYPRAVTITKCAVGDKITNVSHTNALSIIGAVGDNFTGVSVGGFELSANNLLIAGNTADQTDSSIGYYSARNIFITVTDKSLSSTTVKYLTSYIDDNDVIVRTPHLVKISDSKFLIMWEEEKDYTIVTRMTAIDENGDLISDIVDTNMRLSDCAPVLFSDGLVYWFSSDNTGSTLYCVNPEDLASVNNDEVSKTDGLTGSATDASVTLTWTANITASGYIIEEYINNAWIGVADITSHATTTYTINNLSPSSSHKYRVTAYSIIGQTAVYGESTDELAIITNPSPVSSFKLSSRNSTSLTFTWKKNTSATGYVVQQYKSGAWVDIAKITSNATTSYKVTGLTASSTHQFRIRTYKTSGASTLYSNYTSAVSATTLPSPVSSFKLSSRNSTSLTFTWTKNTSATGYVIQQYKADKWVDIAKITSNATTAFTVTGLNPSTAYQFKIRAYKLHGSSTVNSNYSSTVTGTTLPSKMTGFKLSSRNPTSLTFLWTKNNSATGYIVQQYKSGAWTDIAKITNNTTTSYKVTGLTPSVSYQFRVKAYYTDDTSVLYGDYSGTVTATTLPSAMSGFKLSTRNSNALTFTWAENTSATGYIIQQYKSGTWIDIAKITNNTTTSYKVTGLTPSVSYQFRIRAYKINDYGTLYSGYSGTVIATTLPSAMSGFKLSSRNSSTLTFSWNQNASATGYIIQQYKSGAWVDIAKITSNETTSYKVTGLAASTTYQFRIRAYKVNDYGTLYSGYTSAVSATTLPSPVSGFKLKSRNSTSLTLSWTKNTSATGYVIQQYKNGAWADIAKITSNATTTYKVSGLTASSTHQFRIRAYNNSGTSAIYGNYTGTLSATTLPSPVSSLKLSSRTTTTLTFSWAKNTSATGYVIQQYKDGAWVDIAKITTNATTSYKVTGLNKGTTYDFRIRTYKVNGTSTINGNYVSISGTTLK